MRVALLQLALNRKSMAANTQSLLAGIGRAAQATPAPDLLVLPGACDAGGVAPRGESAEAARQSTKEMISTQAREWGVFIAVGLHKGAGGRLLPWAVLFDPDGDIVAQDSSVPTSGAGERMPSVAIWRSAVGNLGVVEPSAAAALTDRLAASQGAFLAVPMRNANLTRRTESFPASLDASLPAEVGIYWGVVLPAGGEISALSKQRATTFLRDPEGNIVVSADSTEETILHAEVPLVPSPAEVEENVYLRGRQAD